MRFASVAEVKDQLSAYLALARKDKERILVTHHSKPYALILPITEADLDGLDWSELVNERLRRAWEGEDDTLYDYLSPEASSSSPI